MPQHFLDSGAFTLWTTSQKYASKNKCGRWDYYHTKEFFAYMDSYAEVVNRLKVGIDLYANLDVIGNPELTYRNQMYLESKGLRPVPVVHFGTDLKWLRRYLKEKHPVIGIGGLVGNTRNSRIWLDDVFQFVCDSEGMPQTKLHGFGVANYWMLRRYPWYSVDSADWVRQAGQMGQVIVPRFRKGYYSMEEKPHRVVIAATAHLPGKVHYLNFSPKEKEIVDGWFNQIGIRIDGESGLLNSREERIHANIRFLKQLVNSLPKYPWVFQHAVRGLF